MNLKKRLDRLEETIKGGQRLTVFIIRGPGDPPFQKLVELEKAKLIKEYGTDQGTSFVIIETGISRKNDAYS